MLWPTSTTSNQTKAYLGQPTPSLGKQIGKVASIGPVSILPDPSLMNRPPLVQGNKHVVMEKEQRYLASSSLGVKVDSKKSKVFKPALVSNMDTKWMYHIHISYFLSI
jgi:hypothetical protein